MGNFNMIWKANKFLYDWSHIRKMFWDNRAPKVGLVDRAQDGEYHSWGCVVPPCAPKRATPLSSLGTSSDLCMKEERVETLLGATTKHVPNFRSLTKSLSWIGVENGRLYGIPNKRKEEVSLESKKASSSMLGICQLKRKFLNYLEPRISVS